MVLTRILDEVVRTDGRRVLAGLIRLTGDFDIAEDVLQEAYAKALVVWPRDGVPAKSRELAEHGVAAACDRPFPIAAQPDEASRIGCRSAAARS